MNIFYSAFCCCKCKTSKSETLQKLEEQRELYDRGIKKFSEEFDWVAVIKSLRQLRAVVKMMMDKNSQTLTLFHSDSLIPIQKSHFLMKMSNKCLNNFWNKNLDSIPKSDWSQEQETRFEEEVNKFMRYYEEKRLEDKEVNLFRSII